MLPDKSRVPLKPAATLRCPMATAIAEWVRGDVAAIATEAGNTRSANSTISTRSIAAAATASPARACPSMAAPMRSTCAASSSRTASSCRSPIARSRASCARNSSPRCARASRPCLGPGSDWYHEDHVHLDLAERRSRLSHLPMGHLGSDAEDRAAVAASRPDDAPPRETAEEKAKREAARRKPRRAEARRRACRSGPAKRVRSAANRGPNAAGQDQKKGAGNSGAFR